MAVKAQDTITLSFMIDIKATYRYYKLQASAVRAPDVPTAFPPSDWTDTEPNYTTGSTNTLYIVDCTVFTNNQFMYTPVSKSSSYEAAKEAYNKATAAQNAASSAQNTANNANNKIDNLEIGGRNLFLQTKDLTTAITAASATKEVNAEGFKVVSGTGTTSSYFDLISFKDFTPEPDTYYTLSFFAKANTNNVNIVSNFYPSCTSSNASSTGQTSSNNDGNVQTTLTTEWKRYWVTWKTKSDVTGAKNIIIVRIPQNNTSTISVYAPKFERGNKATDWTPAPEDVQANIDGIEVGSKNLIVGSNKFKLASYSGGGITYSLTTEKYLQIVAANTTSTIATYWEYDLSGGIDDSALSGTGKDFDELLEEEMHEGDPFTFSMTIKSTGSTAIPKVKIKDAFGYQQMQGTMSTGFSTIYCTGTWKDAGSIVLYLDFNGCPGTYVIKNCKLEKGNKPTGWSLAPEEEIVSVTNEYRLSTSNTSFAGGYDWQATAPAIVSGTYLWTCTKTTLQIGTFTRSDPICLTADPDFASCDTAASTAAKVASISSGGISLVHGTTLSVRFDNANTAANPTLNVGNTGAKPIYTNGLPSAYWEAGATVVFTYDASLNPARWQVASTPVYASEVTVGNSGGNNIFIDSDSIDIRNGQTVLSTFKANDIQMLNGGMQLRVLGDYSSQILMGNSNKGASVVTMLETLTSVPGIGTSAYTAGLWMQDEETKLDGNVITLDATDGDVNLNAKNSILANGNVVLHAENFNSYAAAKSHSHDYLPLSGGTLTGIVTNNYSGSEQFIASASSGNTGFKATRTDKETSVWFGIGSGGSNHGVYSDKVGNWILYNNGTHTFLGANNGNHYRPYFAAGDNFTVDTYTAGYVTNSKTYVCFIIPLAKPAVGSPTVTVSSVDGLIIRQGGSYTHGSAASTWAKPTSYTAWLFDGSHVCIRAVFSTTTNAINNESAGIGANIKIAFS